jgi:hypothetical protein
VRPGILPDIPRAVGIHKGSVAKTEFHSE